MPNNFCSRYIIKNSNRPTNIDELVYVVTSLSVIDIYKTYSVHFQWKRVEIKVIFPYLLTLNLVAMDDDYLVLEKGKDKWENTCKSEYFDVC